MRIFGIVALSLVFGLLCLLALRSCAPDMQNDLSVRSRGALQAAGLGWADVSAEGQDVALQGVAPSETARVKAEEILRRVPGVRTVDNQATLARLAPVGSAPPTAVAYSTDQQVGNRSEVRLEAPLPLDESASCEELAGGEIDLYSVPFHDARYRLNRDILPALDSLVRALKRCRGIRIDVAGHTDANGSVEMNERLSLDRARTVMRYLMNAGIDPNRLWISAHGESQPLADNFTEEGRAVNRRIEFSVQGS